MACWRVHSPEWQCLVQQQRSNWCSVSGVRGSRLQVPRISACAKTITSAAGQQVLVQQHARARSRNCRALNSDHDPRPADDLEQSSSAEAVVPTSSSTDSSSLSVHMLKSKNAALQVANADLVAHQNVSALQQQQQQQHSSVSTFVSPQPSAAAIAAVNAETQAVNRLDIYKAIAIGGAVSVLAGVIDHDWVEAHQGLSMSLLFTLGYVGIMVEELVGLNKAGVALLMAVSLWTIRSTGGDTQIESEVSAALASVSELIFFLLGAMTVVESVDCHGGFKRLASWVKADQRTTLAWGVGLLSFAMSAVLDNLTTTIVMISILQRAIPNDAEFRKLLGAVVVIAANAGGAWTPIGDVTTTMLWIHGQITPLPTMINLLLPSLVSVAVPLAFLCSQAPEFQGSATRTAATALPAAVSASPGLSEQLQLAAAAEPATQPAGAGTSSAAGPDAQEALVLQERQNSHAAASSSSSSRGQEAAETGEQQLLSSNRDLLVLSIGLGALLFVPLFKYLTGLPPFMGMLSGLAVLWMVTDALHWGESRQYPRVQDALRNLDIAGVMFFLGILMSVEALNTAGLLSQLAVQLDKSVGNLDLIAAAIGIVSSLIDNVPLVAATMGMYDLGQYPVDSQLWQLIALCAGTGGSLLVIGSAAGVAYMGVEGVGFGWYMRKVTPYALVGYVAAISLYVALHGLPSST